MVLKKLMLINGEKVIQTFFPESFIRRILTFTSKDASLIISNKRVIYIKDKFEMKDIRFGDIYAIKSHKRSLNIMKKGDSLDYDYDVNFETYEMDRPYISVNWLTNPRLVECLIDDLIAMKAVRK